MLRSAAPTWLGPDPLRSVNAMDYWYAGRMLSCGKSHGFGNDRMVLFVYKAGALQPPRGRWREYP